MSQFKVGDWVRDISSGFVLKAYNNMIEHNFEPWQPKEGEWCWFKFALDEDSLPELGQFQEMFNCDLYISKQNKSEAFEGCEPFIGQLPSFLKNK